MRDASQFVSQQLVAIRAAQAQVARGDVMAAETVMQYAQVCESERASQRDRSEVHWLDVVWSTLPDPSLVRLAGAYLVNDERTLDAARLDTAIAREARDTAGIRHSQAAANLEAARDLHRRRRKQHQQQQETASLAEADGRFLRSWRR